MPSEHVKAKPKTILKRIFNSSWAVTVLGGLILALLTPLVTGFVNLTFSTKSWEVFGVSNEVGAPGSYLNHDAVYKLPINERFRIDGGMLLSVGRYSWKDPFAAIASEDGTGKVTEISSSKSLTFAHQCTRVAIHLMRNPKEEDEAFFVMYTSTRIESEKCQSWWNRLFR